MKLEKVSGLNTETITLNKESKQVENAAYAVHKLIKGLICNPMKFYLNSTEANWL